jgi:DNA-binding CsgD family transcriptional regulator/pimeloyl-ACP methyl ester carboxylesterase
VPGGGGKGRSAPPPQEATLPAGLAAAAAALQASAEAGGPAAGFFDAWPHLNDADPRWQALLDEITEAGASLNPSVATAAAIHPDAVATALVDKFGRARGLSERFAAWIGPPRESPAVRRLIERAAVGQDAIGLVAASDGRVLSVFAGLRRGVTPWAPHVGQLASATDPGVILLVAFWPSNAQALAGRAAVALGLTPLEARVAEALLDAPNLAAAADSIGVGRETAKDALDRAMRKAGVRRAAQFVGVLVELGCGGDGGADSAPAVLLHAAMGLSPREAGVARAIAAGQPAGEAARELGISEETVKSYRRGIFAKTGVNRSRDLRRLIGEVSELDRLASAAEVTAEQLGPQERLKVIRRGDRRIAFVDYGPASGRPLVVGHGFTTGRLLQAPLVTRCQGAGFRVLVPQRPGFGLTSPAGSDFLADGADDLAAILDAERLPATRMVARDGGVATALEFARRHQGRVEKPLLMNPRTPRGFVVSTTSPMSAMARAFLDRPGLIAPFAEMMRRQTRSDILERILRRTCSVAETDRALIEDPAVLGHLVRDMQGLMAHTVRGFIDEMRLYSQGWSPPGMPPQPHWTIAYSGALVTDPDIRPWAGLPGLRVVPLEGAGLLTPYTHADEIIALVT